MSLSNKDLLAALSKMEEKYFNLVWYARSEPTEPVSMIPRAHVEAKYPDEVADICSPEIGDWTHGFNSGMLAALRFVATACEYGVKNAQLEFPFLDT